MKIIIAMVMGAVVMLSLFVFIMFFTLLLVLRLGAEFNSTNCIIIFLSLGFIEVVHVAE